MLKLVVPEACLRL